MVGASEVSKVSQKYLLIASVFLVIETVICI